MIDFELWRKLYALQKRQLPETITYGDFDFAVLNDLILISGVQEKTDLLTAANVGMLDFGDGAVLEGVFDAFAQCSGLIDTLPRPPYGLKLDYTIAGYSFGGALAHVLAKRLYELGFGIRSVITIGAPRTFDKKGALYYDSHLKFCTKRYYFPDDPVCHLPMARAWHVGHPWAMESDGLKPGSDRWSRVVSDLFYDSKFAQAINWATVGMGGALYASNLLNSMAKNHDIERYNDWFETFFKVEGL
jgi:pimeloyl-ACP methyl ester carboxylesterase